MDSSSVSPKSHSLFQVFLRLRPPQAGASAAADRFLTVEEPVEEDGGPTHITLNPPNDRRRAIEKFAFTRVFEEDATQLDIFHCTGVVPLVEGVLAAHGGDGTDALLATLGVTGSGKSHTILGSRTQRGLTQLALDLVFRSLGNNIVDYASRPNLEASIADSDPSEAAMCSASAFIESVYADYSSGPSRPSSRAPTPMIVRSPAASSPFLLDGGTRCHFYSTRYRPMGGSENNISSLPGSSDSPKTVRIVSREDYQTTQSHFVAPKNPSFEGGHAASLAHDLKRSNTMPGLHPDSQYQSLRDGMTPSRKQKGSTMRFMAVTASAHQKRMSAKPYHNQGDHMGPPPTPSRRLLNRPSALPQQPDITSLSLSCDPACEYAVVISMYEVYNDRIFDLLTPPIKSSATKEYRRRPLLFKSTEASPDRKVVAGLRKVVCSSLQQALMVLEAGLHERRVAGTGSNSVSSRSHGFICVEVKKRARASRSFPRESAWGGNTLTIVDLAGSERARDAKTAGVTLAEAGKINESLMYLGQCLQMQSDSAHKDKPGVVPFRQCKLTELLFSNSFPSVSSYSSSTTTRRNPQKAVMIVTADPRGDFNATSQILRYSALAREITVPRIPSITQTILSATTAAATPALSSSPVGSPPLYQRSFFPPGAGTGCSSTTSPNTQRNFSPTSTSEDHRSTMEHAALEIARLSEEVDYLRQALQTEQSARMEAEAHLLSMEDRMVDLEQAIREDCASEFERRLDIEMARWRANMQVEMERGEEHWGRKIEVFERTLADDHAPDGDDGGAGGENKENVLVEDMAEENDRLRRDNEILRRELAAMSPTKRMPLRERASDTVGAPPSPTKTRGSVETGSPRASRTRGSAGDGGLYRKMERLRVSDDGEGGRQTSGGGGSPKKMRKLVAKRWEDGVDEDEVF